MKKPQRSSFKFSPVATAVAVALTSQFAANVAQAGAGWGSGLTTANTPVALPTFYANSPAGPAPTIVGGVLSINPTTALPNPVNTGKALRKFVDTLPTIPAAVPEKWVNLNGVVTNDDYYEIAAVEYTQKMHSDLPKATRLRGYVQLMTPGLVGKPGVVAKNFTLPNGTVVQVVDNPHHLGPIINATKGTAVRVKFTNFLPTGAAGNLFLPVDTTITGAGVGPDGVTFYSQNRANLHLVGGEAPWISAGTPHQWIAPAGEINPASTALGAAIAGGQLDARGASAQNVPDMADPGPGSSTLYFPNDLSARFTFMQDRTSGLMRLNAYAGLEAGYVVSDDAEKALIASKAIPGADATIPLIIEDKTFVPSNVGQQDARWDTAKWGQPGDLWFPHVYEPSQDPASITGANPVGRWTYGPLFWPIFPTMRGDLPQLSTTPEAYLDTPVINGVAYPKLTVDPKAYRLRILNASNDRYINLGLYKADPTVQAPQLDQNGNPIVDAAGNQQFFTNTEVKMVPAAADLAGNPPNWDATNGVQLPLPQYANLPLNINVASSGPARAWPKDGRAGGAPDPTLAGPDFVVIGNDGGLIPNPVDIPSQPVTYETNRRSITVLNIYGYGMLLGPAERADTVVDFSQFAGQTLILYNDAPAPTPFNDPRNDYYTGNPDQTAQGGAYTTQPGYGPNTRTMMQITVRGPNSTPPVTPAPAYNADALLTALPAAYASSNPPIVPAVAYNAAFGTNDVDVIAHVATGSSAQPTLDYTTTGQLTLQSLNLITSGGTGAFGNVVGSNAVPGSGSGYRVAPLVSIVGGGGTGATATATVDNVPTVANKGVPTFQVTGLTLDNAGTGYTSAPTVLFTPQPALTSITLNNSGSGYTAPKVTIGAPNVGGGTQATATATIAVNSPVSPTVAISNPGSGYTAPLVSFTGGGAGTGAAAYATISSSPLASTGSIGLGGSGYTAPKANLITSPANPGTGAVASVAFASSVSPVFTLVNGGAAYDLAIADGGTGSTIVDFTNPQTANGTKPTATATVDKTTGSITGITLLTPGSGYTSAPTVTISDNLGGFTPATFTAAIAPGTGVVTGVTFTNVGSGYTQAPTINIVDSAGGTGSGATATASLANTAGTLVGITFTNTGSGYTSAPAIVLTDAGAVNASAVTTTGLNKAVGAIASITITEPGSGYTSAPSIQILDSLGGTGSGASATAGMVISGVGAQASVMTTNTKSIVVGTKAEQELFDDYGRYNSTGGVEIPLVNGVIQTTIPLNYIDSATEVHSDISLNNQDVQVWKLVDNGLWSNSVHFDMVDVQLINRVGWDGTVKPIANNELGWKDTLRLNPLEDAIVAMRAKTATVPFGQPKSSRLLDPSKPLDTTATHPTRPALPVAGVTYASGLGFTGALAVGVTPVVAAKNEVREFDHEFTWGSAILGHAENDFRRPVIFNPTVGKPDAPINLVDPLGNGVKLSWTDATPSLAAATLANAKNELGFKVVKALAPAGVPGAFDLANPVATLPANATGWTEAPSALANVAYAVVAYNVAGDSVISNPVINAAPAAPTCAAATQAFITPAASTADVAVTLNCFDNANNEQTFLVSRSGGAGPVVNTTLPAITAVPSTLTFPDSPVVENTTYTYSLTASNVFGTSAPVTKVVVTTGVSAPLAPTNLGYTAVVAAPCPAVSPWIPLPTTSLCKPNNVNLTWTDAAFNEATYTVSRVGGDPFVPVTLPGNALNNTGLQFNYVDPTAQEGIAYTYTVTATNVSGSKATTLTVTLPVTAPTLPTNLAVVPSTAVDAHGTYVDEAVLTWTDNAFNETGYNVLRNGVLVGTAPANAANDPMGTATTSWTASPTMTFTDKMGLADGVTYTWAVQAVNGAGQATSANVVQKMSGIIIAPPTNLVATPNRAGSSIGLSWIDRANNETDYLVEEATSTDGTNWTPYIDVLPIIARTAAQTTGVGGTVTQNRANVPTTVGLIYSFRVSARNLANKSDSHPYATVQSNLAAPALPTAPLLNAAVLNAATRRVTLTWNAVAPVGATTVSYILNVNGVAVPTNLTTYTYRPTVAQLTAGLTFSVQTVARANRVPGQTVFGSSRSAASNVVTLQATAPAAAAVPAGLAATVSAAGAVRLNWTAVAGVTGSTLNYLVSVNGGTTSFVMASGGTIPAASIPVGSIYSVSVASQTTALGLSTPSAFSAPVTVDLTAAVAPVAPATLTVTATALNWAAATAVPTNATVTYTVQKSVDGVTWTPVAGPIAARTFAIASPVGTNYQYRVAAQATRYGLAPSALSGWTTTTFNTLPAQSTNLAVALAGTKNFSVSWTNTSSNITGFIIQRRSPAGVWSVITPTVAVVKSGNNYSFADATMTVAGSYTYRVQASSVAGNTAVLTSLAVITP